MMSLDQRAVSVNTSAVPASTLVSSAYAALKAAILANDYPAGHQIAAQELADRLGMSRTPVQEAALRLQQEGLLDILPKRGIRIRAISPEDIAEIYEVLIALEGQAAARIAASAPTARNAAVTALKEATDGMAKALAAGDLEVWAAEDARFHALLIEHCRNQRFAAIIANVNAQAHRARMLTVHLRPALAGSINEHRAIIAAIRNGLPEVAHKAAANHRARARDELLPLLARMGLRHL